MGERFGYGDAYRPLQGFLAVKAVRRRQAEPEASVWGNAERSAVWD